MTKKQVEFWTNHNSVIGCLSFEDDQYFLTFSLNCINNYCGIHPADVMQDEIGGVYAKWEEIPINIRQDLAYDKKNHLLRDGDDSIIPDSQDYPSHWVNRR